MSVKSVLKTVAIGVVVGLIVHKITRHFEDRNERPVRYI